MTYAMSRFRPYRKNDLEAIFRLDKACFAEEFRFDRRSMSAFAEEKDAIVLIAEERGDVIAFVIAHLAAGREAYIITLDVAPEWRRRGLAGTLMAEVEMLAWSKGARWIRLHVYRENEGAIRFYERLGYQRSRVINGYYGEGLDALVYGKKLSPL
jgi:[ribosomal protein S18]-alanine N-acetyltransferase